MTDNETQRTSASDPSQLDREELLALVRDLQRKLDGHQTTIDRQTARLAELQSVVDGRIRASALATPSPVQPAPAAPKRRTMSPVTGFDYTFVFDGGSINNPGRGYGSYQIVNSTGEIVGEDNLDYGPGISNNSAEYRSLIAGLERVIAVTGNRARTATVAIRGDSQLIIRQVKGEWKVNHIDLKPLHARARELIAQIGRADLQWHPRDKSVRILGH
ncbi:MAG: ribonuclease HI family protein [Thermomicrobiales bacterium]